MAYFKTVDVAAIAICGALWGVLNLLFAPPFFRATGMPFLCDLIGFAVLVLGAWWIRKPGFLTFVGLIATIINLALGTGMQFLGFLAASAFFDVAVAAIGYGRAFKKPSYTAVSMMILAIASAAVAGAIIGAVFHGWFALTGYMGWRGWLGRITHDWRRHRRRYRGNIGFSAQETKNNRIHRKPKLTLTENGDPMSARQAFFNQAAQNWDKEFGNPKLHAFLEQFVPSFGLSAGQHVLDVGTGTGILIPFLHKALGAKGHITAIDYAPNMVGNLQDQVCASSKRFNNSCRCRKTPVPRRVV